MEEYFLCPIINGFDRDDPDRLDAASIAVIESLDTVRHLAMIVGYRDYQMVIAVPDWRVRSKTGIVLSDLVSRELEQRQIRTVRMLGESVNSIQDGINFALLARDNQRIKKIGVCVANSVLAMYYKAVYEGIRAQLFSHQAEFQFRSVNVRLSKRVWLQYLFLTLVTRILAYNGQIFRWWVRWRIARDQRRRICFVNTI